MRKKSFRNVVLSVSLAMVLFPSPGSGLVTWTTLPRLILLVSKKTAVRSDRIDSAVIEDGW